jgi:hypothetical protein
MLKFITALGLAFFAAGSHAQISAPQQRVFPPNTAWGTLVMGVFPQASIEGRDVRFAPGARILNTANLLQLPLSIQQPVVIRYRLDTQGQIQEAWILNSAEEQAARQSSRPRALGGSNE